MLARLCHALNACMRSGRKFTCVYTNAVTARAVRALLVRRPLDGGRAGRLITAACAAACGGRRGTRAYTPYPAVRATARRNAHSLSPVPSAVSTQVLAPSIPAAHCLPPLCGAPSAALP
jgi:hypothetical protein